MKDKDLFFHVMSNFTKKVKFTTKVMVTKNAPLHIYVLRSIYDIVSVCRLFLVILKLHLGYTDVIFPKLLLQLF